jgi:hypothetical protein
MRLQPMADLSLSPEAAKQKSWPKELSDVRAFLLRRILELGRRKVKS